MTNTLRLRKNLLSLLLFITLLSSSSVFAWDGYKDNGEQIEIETYDHEGKGEGPVEYYDSETGEYRTGYLDVYPGGSATLTDDETGEDIEVQMD